MFASDALVIFCLDFQEERKREAKQAPESLQASLCVIDSVTGKRDHFQLLVVFAKEQELQVTEQVFQEGINDEFESGHQDV